MKCKLYRECRCASIVPILFSPGGYLGHLNLTPTSDRGTITSTAFRLACIAQHCPFPMIRLAALAEMIDPIFGDIRTEVRRMTRERGAECRRKGFRVVDGGLRRWPQPSLSRDPAEGPHQGNGSNPSAS
jgi:hypothetical protein